MCFHVFFSDHTSFKCMSVCQRESIHAPISFGELCYSATHRPHSKSWRLKKKESIKMCRAFRRRIKQETVLVRLHCWGEKKRGETCLQVKQEERRRGDLGFVILYLSHLQKSSGTQNIREVRSLVTSQKTTLGGWTCEVALTPLPQIYFLLSMSLSCRLLSSQLRAPPPPFVLQAFFLSLIHLNIEGTYVMGPAPTCMFLYIQSFMQLMQAAHQTDQDPTLSSDSSGPFPNPPTTWQ